MAEETTLIEEDCEECGRTAGHYHAADCSKHQEKE